MRGLFECLAGPGSVPLQRIPANDSYDIEYGDTLPSALGWDEEKTGIMSSQAGWYAQPEGQKTYWDGRQWTHRWVPGVGAVTWKDSEASSEQGAGQPSESARAQRNEASVVDIAEIANNPRLSPNKKLLIMEQLQAGRSLVDIMEEIAVQDAKEIKTLKEKATASAAGGVSWSPTAMGLIAAVVLALGLVWAYGGSQGAGQQSGPTDSSGGSDSGAKAAACARVVTIQSQLSEIRRQRSQAMSGYSGGDPAVSDMLADLSRQEIPLNKEKTAQNRVCKG